MDNPEKCAPVPEAPTFIFLWWEDDEYGVYVTKIYFDFMKRLYLARETAKTWQEFLDMLDAFDREFVRTFIEFEDPVLQAGDRIDDIRDEVYVLSDEEFPIVQCVQETYHCFGHLFLGMESSETITTEYLERFEQYPKSAFVEMKEHLEQRGYGLVPMLSPFPKALFNYY